MYGVYYIKTMIDKVEIHVKAGDGGSGVVSFRREKFVPFGGPDGGDGGNGGGVILVADATISTLRQFSMRHYFAAERGQDGGGKKMRGKSGEDLFIGVPLGTVVSRSSVTGERVALGDLINEQEQIQLVQGGRGGFGRSAAGAGGGRG